MLEAGGGMREMDSKFLTFNHKNLVSHTICDIMNLIYRQDMLRLYPDAEATMGEGRLVGETGPDEAGKNLQPTTVKVSEKREWKR